MKLTPKKQTMTVGVTIDIHLDDAHEILSSMRHLKEVQTTPAMREFRSKLEALLDTIEEEFENEAW